MFFLQNKKKKENLDKHCLNTLHELSNSIDYVLKLMYK